MRSRSMRALTIDIAGAYPGVVIYGVGDLAHQLRASDHNEDDTAGSRPAQSDADSDPEHRAIDVMLGPAMSRARMQALVERVIAGEQARERAGGAPRLFYVIFDGWIWSRSNNWVKQPHTDDPHPDHAHFSGLAAGDDIADRWPAVTAGDDMAFAENANSDPHGMTTLYRVYDGILNLKEEFDNHVNNKAEPSPFAKAINGLVRDVAELKTREPVIVTDEQLERVLRKVIGSVDEAQVRADAG